ncbi:flagellar basal-body rod protein FlgG [Undibacterium sp. TJN25]|uniref:flagellar basal-body rod protein FlgG n=1 Tax=Undibacterium sp. TJN25 TaxID=3413056 RepID=UPI003BF10EBF
MNDSLYIAATGMQAQQLNVNTTANNLANMLTPGFKAGRVNFQDMVHQMGHPTSADNEGNLQQAHGIGVNVSSLSTLFALGDLQKSTGPLDIAIQGSGFLEVTMPDGSHAYSRGGSLQVNADGFLTTPDGSALKPSIHVGADAKVVTITADGKVQVQTSAQGAAVEVGSIEMSNFADPSTLNALGQNLYKPTAKSGDPVYGKPGDNGMGTISQGYLEASNVNMVNEMVNLMTAQRAYEMNVKVIQASDEMLGMSNNLRR